MRIDVAITLNEGETFSLTPEETAQQIIDAFDEFSTDTDYCSVSIRQPQQGGVGYIPPPLSPPEPGDPSYIEPPPIVLPPDAPYPDQSLPGEQPVINPLGG